MTEDKLVQPAPTCCNTCVSNILDLLAFNQDIKEITILTKITRFLLSIQDSISVAFLSYNPKKREQIEVYNMQHTLMYSSSNVLNRDRTFSNYSIPDKLTGPLNMLEGLNIN